MGIGRQFKGYIFDVDGTLIDSAADICGAIQDVLLSAERVAHFVDKNGNQQRADPGDKIEKSGIGAGKEKSAEPE